MERLINVFFYIVWFLQCIGLHQFIGGFRDDNFAMNYFGISQDVALFLSSSQFLFCGFLRAYKFKYNALILNFLHHGTREAPIHSTWQSIKYFLVLFLIILGVVFYIQYADSVYATLEKIFQPIWIFLDDKILNWSLWYRILDFIYPFIVFYLIFAWVTEFFEFKVTSNFLSYWQVSYVILLLVALFLGEGYKTIQNEPSFFSEFGVTIGYGLGAAILGYLGAVVIILLTKLHQLIDKDQGNSK